MKTILVTLLALAFTATAASAACNGADPSIASVAVSNVTSTGGLNHYHVRGTVTNIGSQAQPSNTLQFVNIYENGQKLDDKGIPPLAPGQSYQFEYVSDRSVQAGVGSSKLVFRLDVEQPASAECGPAAPYDVSF